MDGGYDVDRRSQKEMTSRPQRQSGGRGGGRPPQFQLQLDPDKSPDYATWRNFAVISALDVPHVQDDSDLRVLINGRYVLSARARPDFPQGRIGLNGEHRKWMEIALTDRLMVESYDPFSQGADAYLASMDIEIGFMSKSKISKTPYDQDDLQSAVVSLFQNQTFAPGQRLCMEVKNIPVYLAVKTVQLGNLGEKTTSSPTTSDPTARGILTNQTQIAFYKDGKSEMQLKASKRRPAANSILTPDFKFEDMVSLAHSSTRILCLPSTRWLVHQN